MSSFAWDGADLAAEDFRCPTGGPAYATAGRALEQAYGKLPGETGSGGSIPLLQTLQQAAPNAEFICPRSPVTGDVCLPGRRGEAGPEQVEH